MNCLPPSNTAIIIPLWGKDTAFKGEPCSELHCREMNCCFKPFSVPSSRLKTHHHQQQPLSISNVTPFSFTVIHTSYGGSLSYSARTACSSFFLLTFFLCMMGTIVCLTLSTGASVSISRLSLGYLVWFCTSFIAAGFCYVSCYSICMAFRFFGTVCEFLLKINNNKNYLSICESLLL